MIASHCIPEFGFHLLGGIIHILFVFSGAFVLLWYYLKNKKEQHPEPVKQPQESPERFGVLHTILPLRLQAFERFVLFLERIHPSNLVMRLNNPDLSSVQLQSLLVRTIREEFEYNLSQQLYVSLQNWEMIRNAKEEMISLINQASVKAGENATAGELVKLIFDLTVEKGRLPLEQALAGIKKEFDSLS
jgi:hypothetical protein